MRIALDTNLLVYAEGLNGAERQKQVHHLLSGLADAQIVLPVQVLGELFAVLIRKGGWPPARARDTVLAWKDSFETIETSHEIATSAFDLCVDHNFAPWDAIIMTAAAHSGCRFILTEDMQDGFTWAGVTIANPFAAPLNPLLQAMIGNG